MGDQAYPRGPEPAVILLGAGDLGAEFRREAALDGRDVDTDLLEDTAFHHRHLAAIDQRRFGTGILHRAALLGGARPAAALETSGGEIGVAGADQIVLQRLEGGADTVPELAEPGGCRLSARVGGRVK